jgi:hypothetical protein
MFKLLEQLQLFDSDTVSAKQVWMDIKTMLRKAIGDFQSPVRQRTRHTDLLYAEAISAKQCPMSLHPKLGFKKHGNGIHPPFCFLFKCVS